MTERQHHRRVDIAIIGAGPVGMTLALALAGGPQRVLLIDSRAARRLGRRSAGAGAVTRQPTAPRKPRRLERQGAGTSIETIHVSQRGGFGRTLIDAGTTTFRRSAT
jgi:2-octaprenyl-6-methoxyphenol hydroxylase